MVGKGGVRLPRKGSRGRLVVGESTKFVRAKGHRITVYAFSRGV